MLRCLTIKSPSSSTTASVTAGAGAGAGADLPSCPPPSQVGLMAGNSRHETPRSTSTASTQLSPTVNLSREYTHAIQTDSYKEIWSRIHVSKDDDAEDGETTHQIVVHSPQHSQHQLDKVLQPNRECVQEALRYAKPNTLTHLISTYFEHSENTTHLCLLIYNSIDRPRSLYGRLKILLETLPVESHSLTPPHCEWASDVFKQFDGFENPFLHPDEDSSHNFHDMRNCFSQLKQQLDRRLRKSRSKIRLLRHTTTGTTLCFIATAFGVIVSAVVIAAHALVVLVASPIFTAFWPPHSSLFGKKERAHMAQLDAADKGIYVLNNDLDTIDRLVAHLHEAVKGDKQLVRSGLETGMDEHTIQCVVNLLRNDHLKVINLLKDLEEHICLCFLAINRARSLLLQEVLTHQSCNTSS